MATEGADGDILLPHVWRLPAPESGCDRSLLRLRLAALGRSPARWL